MKLLPCLAAAVVLLAAGGARAQEPDFGAQRERLKAERATVEARFSEEQRACRAKFAVTDCMRAITRERNATLADLRRQENALNDAVRLRREERRQRELAEREANKQREEQVRRDKAALEYKDREARAAALEKKRAAEAARPHPPVVQRAPKGATSPQGTPRASVLPDKPSGPTPEEAAKNRQAYERRLQEAEAHKAEVRARIAKRSKPAASALPAPATPASGS
jgi:colicin import membrane protein